MGAILAIVGDTWRQSKQQVVFIIMLILMAVLGIASLVLVKIHPGTPLDELTDVTAIEAAEAEIDPIKTERQLLASQISTARNEPDSDTLPPDFDLDEAEDREDELGDKINRLRNRVRDGRRAIELQTALAELDSSKDESEDGKKARARLERDLSDLHSPKFGIRWFDEPMDVFADMWLDTYAEAERQRRGETLSMKEMSDPERLRELQEQAQKDAEERALVPRFQRSVEMWINNTVGLMFTLSMWLFIAACAGYFPGLVAAGAVDVVLAKPLSRLKIFMGKYLGGLVLFGLALFGFNTFLYSGMGILTGVWHDRLFLSMPYQVFTAGVLYAILGLVGVATRSATFAMILGFFFYLVIDSVLTIFFGIQSSGVFSEWPWVETTAETLKTALPNFGLLKAATVNMSLNIPPVSYKPFITAAGWLVGCLALGYWLFRNRDY